GHAVRAGRYGRRLVPADGVWRDADGPGLFSARDGIIPAAMADAVDPRDHGAGLGDRPDGRGGCGVELLAHAHGPVQPQACAGYPAGAAAFSGDGRLVVQSAVPVRTRGGGACRVAGIALRPMAVTDMNRFLRRALHVALTLSALAGALYGLAWLNIPAYALPSDDSGSADFTDPALVARGAYVARLGDCAGCHTALQPGSPPFAGGQPMNAPFGIIY